jgi:hypothetical protein
MRRWAIIVGASLLAGCQSPPDAVQAASAAAHKAADQFAALAQASATSGQVPRQTDAAAGPLLDAVFNTAVLQGAPSSDDLDAVNDWLMSAVKVGQTYILAGTGLTDSAGANAQAQARIGQNVVSFLPECGRFLDAELAIEGADASDVAQYLAKNPDAPKDATKTPGLDKARAGIAETAQGVITTVAGTGLPNDWREARARSLIAFAPHAGGFLDAAQKQALSTAATQAAAVSDDAQLAALLNQFAAAIVAGPAS